MLYRIKDWSVHFENNRTRELGRMTWVPMPNKHDGDGYTELVDHPNGAAHFGAWCAIVQVASKCDPRGTLLRDSAKPHDPASLARVTRLSQQIFDEVIPRLLSIGWLETQPVVGQAVEEMSHVGATEPQDVAPRVRASNGTEGTGMEGNGNGRSIAADHSDSFISTALGHLAPIIKRVRTEPGDLFPARVALAVTMGIIPAALAMDAAEGVAVVEPAPRRPGAYFFKCVKEACAKRGIDIERIKRVQVPEGFPPPSLDEPRRRRGG